MERCVSWRDDSDAAGCFATNLGSRVDMGELATTSSFLYPELGKELG